MNKLLVILGSTSTGKTDLGLLLAKKFNGELISADSRQVYKGLDIGTGKMPNKMRSLRKGRGFWEIDGIKIWMYDVISPKRQYTVADYVKDANKVIGEIRKRGKLPILVGGTGLYLKALLFGLSNLSVPIDEKLRKQLEQLTVTQLQQKLKKISAEKWEKMNYSDQQNPRRLIRAIELDGKGNQLQSGLTKETEVLKIGLTAPREVLYQRSDNRVVSRIKQGMIEEAERLRNKGLSLKRMRQLGLEYGVLADYLERKIKTREKMVKILQSKIHGFVRRQLTWFKKEKNIIWFDIIRGDFSHQVEKKVSEWYH